MIHNLERFVGCLWNWDILAGCFGATKIKLTDIDGAVERNGQTLIIEAKSGTKPIPQGQRIMYETWAKTGFFTIIIVWGEPGLPEAVMAFRPNGTILERKAADLAEFRKMVADWYAWANQRKRVSHDPK